jgi:hypothetical protein
MQDNAAPQYILAFRTITTILNVLQNAPLTTQSVQNMHILDAPIKREGQILSALANLLVRADEVAAVVSQPGQGFGVQVIACINPDETVDVLSDDLPDATAHLPTVHPDQPHHTIKTDDAADVTADIDHSQSTDHNQTPATSHADCNGDFLTTINPRRPNKPIPNDAMTFTGTAPHIFQPGRINVDVFNPLAYVLTCW